MYTLNGISLQDYGIVPSQIGNGNIAISGAWDMPVRIGKIFHDWGDEDGIEPYLRADEIFFGGRDISFYGFMQTDSREDALANLAEFFDALDDTDQLMTLSSDLGEWEVYVSSDVSVTYHYGDNIAELRFTFRQPSVPIPVAELPDPDNGSESMDGMSWQSLGLIFLSLVNDIGRPAPKEQTVTVYGRETYQKTKRQFRELDFKGVIVQPDWAGFKMVLDRLYMLFAGPNARTLYMADGTVREVFVKDGFQLTNVCIENSRVIGEIAVRFTEIRQLNEWNNLTDTTGLVLVDQHGQPISEIINKY